MGMSAKLNCAGSRTHSKIISDREWLRIAAIHHNIRRGPVADDENLRDFGDLQRILGDYVNLFLHGHTYDGKTDWLNPKVPILATGSAALNVKECPEETSNQYQIVQIWADAFKRWARAYSPTNKRWEGDTKASRSGDTWWDEQDGAVRKGYCNIWPDDEAHERDCTPRAGVGSRRRFFTNALP